MRLRGLVLGWVLMSGLGQGLGLGQTVATGMGTNSDQLPTTMDAALHAMSDRAAVVFVGTVTAVRRMGVDPSSTAGGVVEVQFAVEQGMRGCATGGSYTLREWAGMWSGTADRYRVGERMFMMLHAPQASGLSSPVDGARGAMPVHGGGGTVGEKDQAAGAGSAVVDLRWVGAKLARPVVYRKETTRWSRSGGQAAAAVGNEIGTGVAAASAMTRVVQGGAAAVGAEAAAAAAVTEAAPQASVPAQEASVSALASRIAAWKKVTDANR